MATSAQTRRTSDLNRGWEEVFESSVSTARELARLGGAEPLLASQNDDGLRLGH
jgi:hypothetical protein